MGIMVLTRWVMTCKDRRFPSRDRTWNWDNKPTIKMLIDMGQPTARAQGIHRGDFVVDGDGDTYCLALVENPVVSVDSYISEHDIWSGFQKIIDQITYKQGWYFRTGVEDQRMWVQVGVTEEAEISFDPIAGKKVPWRGAKHDLSMHMCRNEIVSIVFHAIERAELHEVKEWFRYKSRSIFNPHIDPDVLVEVASKASSFNVRQNAMTMDEEEVK